MEESGELIFLRYGFPTLGSCSQEPINTHEFSKFEEMLKTDGIPSRERLQKIFPNGAKRLKSWEPEDVRDYWLIEHNEIKKNNAICKVYVFTISDILPAKGNELYRLRFKEEKISLIAKSYIPVKEGDRVTIHGPQVAEIFERKIAEKYESYFIK